MVARATLTAIMLSALAVAAQTPLPSPAPLDNFSALNDCDVLAAIFKARAAPTLLSPKSYGLACDWHSRGLEFTVATPRNQ